MSSGIVVIAENTDTVDYIECARTLAKSVRLTNRDIPISIITANRDQLVDHDYELFDKIIEFTSTSTNQWKLDNDWRVFELSPYQHTLKIESDVVLTMPINNWFEFLRTRSVNIAVGCVDYRQNISRVRTYRDMIDRNKLSDVYNGLTYFNKDAQAEQFFTIVKDIFEKWTDYRSILRYSPESEFATTDIVYAIAAFIIGEDQVILPEQINPLRWVHMKPAIINTLSDDWSREFIIEHVNNTIKINSYVQQYPIHYVYKPLAKIFGDLYDRAIT